MKKLVDEFRRNGLGLAAYSAYQESPAETKCLRAALTGEPAGYSSPWDPLWDARFKRGGTIAGAVPERKVTLRSPAGTAYRDFSLTESG